MCAASSTRLLRSAVSSGTNNRYDNAVEAFLCWLKRRNYRSLSLLQDIDTVLNDYVHFCWDNNLAFTRAKNAVLGLKALHPSFKIQLPLATTAVTNWDKIRPKGSYPPMPKVVVYCIAVYLVSRGKCLHALATLLGFHTYCRSNELLELRGKHVMDAAD